MDDPWGNAWSASGSKDDTESSKKSLDGSKWNTLQKDADEDTVDVGVPSWTVASGVGWGDGPSNLWHAESSTLNAWGTSGDSHEAQREGEPEEEPEDDELEEEVDKDVAPRTILPTPPQSPLPLPSPPVPLSAEEPPSPNSPLSPTAPASPDPFGSFESAEAVEEELPQPSSWAPKTPTFVTEAADEPWGGAWGGNDVKDEEEEGPDETLNDEWELAQQARRRRDRKVPPELLGSLVAQWDGFAKEIYPNIKQHEENSQSWRKGLDSVKGLTELVDTLIPVESFPPPVQFSKTAVAKSVKESLRLTRTYTLARASPMAHLYASKGSNDWERSVKAQGTAASDEWGWDLKHEPEEKPDPADSAKDKKGGLLSFWGRKTSSTPSTPAADSSVTNQPKSPITTSKPVSPAASARPSIDISATTATSSRIASPTAVITQISPTAAAEAAETINEDGSAVQPSAVSRFFNRFSRKPSAAAPTSAKESRRSLALSANDLSFLSDMAPSTSDGSTLSHRGTDSVGSLEAMLSSSSSGQKYSSPSSSKLPPPLAPPPPPSSRSAGPVSAVSQASDASFDAKMAEAQLMDLLVDLGGQTSSKGYAPVSFDLIDSPAESKPEPSALRSPALPSLHQSLPPPPLPQPPVVSPGTNPGSSQRGAAGLSAVLSPMTISPSASPRPVIQGPATLPSLSPPPLPPPRSSANVSRRPSSIHRFDNPLPPPPKNDLDDFSDFFSASGPPAQPRPQQGSSPSSPALSPTTPNFRSPMPNQPFFTPSAGVDTSDNFGDFGDFISTPILRSPSPPKVPRKTSRAANHKPTIALVANAASRPGRWPAPPSPLPQPLAPPPSTSSGPDYFNKSSMQKSQHDFLDDDSPVKAPPTSGAFLAPGQVATLPPPPIFAAPPSRPSSTSFPRFSPPPSAAPTSQPSTPLSSPFDGGNPPPKPPAKSGLSAQDLSFFEGL